MKLFKLQAIGLAASWALSVWFAYKTGLMTGETAELWSYLDPKPYLPTVAEQKTCESYCRAKSLDEYCGDPVTATVYGTYNGCSGCECKWAEGASSSTPFFMIADDMKHFTGERRHRDNVVISSEKQTCS